MDAGKIRLITIAVAIVLVLMVEILVGKFSAGLCSAEVAVLCARLIEAVVLPVGIYLCQRRLASVGLGRGTLIRGIRAGVLWAAVFGGLAAAAGTLLLAAGVNPLQFFEMPLPAGGRRLLVFLVTGAVVSPFVEEIFFRGLLYGFFRRWGVPAGIILTTAVFAGAHLSVASLPVTQIIGGVVFCLAYEKEKSLLTPYVIHALGNAAIFGLGMIGGQGGGI